MVLDGYPLKQQGHGQLALEASLKSGWATDVFSDIVTILVCAPLGRRCVMVSPSGIRADNHNRLYDDCDNGIWFCA